MNKKGLSFLPGIKWLLLFFVLFSPMSHAFLDKEGVYIGALGGVANTVAFGVRAVEPPFTTAFSDVKNTAHPYYFGAVLGYDWSRCSCPISTEFMFINMNKQKYHITNMYPFFPGTALHYSEHDRIFIKNNFYLINGIYHFEANNGFKPFMGAGIGIANLKTSGLFYSKVTPFTHNGVWRKKSTTKFAYDLLLGLSYCICPNVEASLAYQFLSYRKISTFNTVLSNEGVFARQTLLVKQINMNNIFFGLKYLF